MTGIADGNVGIWDLTGLDAPKVGCDFSRLVTILNNDDLPNALNISWVVSFLAEIRTGRLQDTEPGELISTPVVAFSTDGTDGIIRYTIARAELAADAAGTDRRHDIIGVDASGNRYPLLLGRVHIRPTATEGP